MAINKMITSIGFVLGGMLFFTAGCFQSTQVSTASALGMPAHALTAVETFNTTQEGSFSLDTYKGKVIAVDFWATWCGPCVRSIPHLSQWHQDYAERGLVVIGYTDRSSQNVEQFIKDHHMDYLVAVAESLGDNDYGVTSIPHLVLIDHEGNILKRDHPDNFTNGDIETALMNAGL